MLYHLRCIFAMSIRFDACDAKIVCWQRFDTKHLGAAWALVETASISIPSRFRAPINSGPWTSERAPMINFSGGVLFHHGAQISDRVGLAAFEMCFFFLRQRVMYPD